MFDLNRFLELREERVELQKNLLNQFNYPLIAIRTNYPGENKLEPLAIKIADIASNEIKELLKIKLFLKKY